MAKSNPLFVDSTVLHGDRISTQIELTCILLYEGETVSVVLTNHLREMQHVVMKMSDEGTFHARLWLSHQKLITYRFVVERDGRTLYKSFLFESRAQYALIEEWDPDLNHGPAAEKTPAAPAPKPKLVESRLPEDNGRSFSTLMEKWGL